MVDLIFKFRQVFSFKHGLSKIFEYNLKINDEEPYHVKPHPIPKMVENGIISRSTSLGCRGLNKRMEADRETLPGIEEILMK